MATQTWVPGRIGQWNVTSNWTTDTVPTSGDTAVIGSGEPTIDGLTIVGETIVLSGSSSATLVTLTANDATFVGTGSGATELHTTLTVTGAGLQATFNAEGATSFDGLVFVGAVGGGLTIDAASSGGSFTFDNADGHAVMVVYQESTLTFSGGTIVNDGIIQVEGGLHIASGVDFTLSATSSNQSGQAAILLENGGNVLIGGSVGSGEFFDFVDSTGRVTLQSGATFSGTFGFAPGSQQTTIDVQGIEAASLSFVSATNTQPGALQLLGSSGQVLVQYNVDQLDGNFAPLSASSQTLNVHDFELHSDGHGGSLITYSPDVPQVLQQSLPVPIQAAAGTMVSLSSILEQSFGSADPGFYSITLLSGTPYTNSSTDIGYWQPSDIAPQWYVGSSAITSATIVTDISQVYLKVGNQIPSPAQFKVEVTSGTTGRLAEDVIYNAWSIDPAIAAGVGNSGISGLPTPADVIASAYTFASTYGLIPNTNLCNWIADNVAAGAGAPMPPQNAFVDPSQNEPGGFWRIVYTGVGSDPQSNWSTLVQPGDIVRMGWFHPETGVASGHTTTVLGTLTSSGEMLFYDNIASSDGVEVIGVHYNDYWTRTDPADITIYRLDPNSQYLILGTDLSERIQGTVYNDLIQPGGGADTIVTGPGRDEIQGTTAELASITVTDFAPGDSFDFTDLALGQASVSFSGGALHVASNGTEVATLTVAAPQAGQAYLLAFDGNSGTTVQLGVPVSSGQTLTISSGQIAGGVIVLSGGTEIVLSGGLASGNTVWSGGSVLVSGGETVGDVLFGSGSGGGALEVVLAGGVASGAIVSNAGLLVVSSGGLAAGAVLVSSSVGSNVGGDGVLMVSSGGTASGTQVRVGGLLVQQGGVDSGTAVMSGGREIVSSGAAIDTVVLNGGSVTVMSGGAASGTIVSDGGRLDILSGASAVGTTVSSGGTLEQAGGATLTSTALRVGATYELVSGASVNGFGVTRGILLEIGPGATATGTTVSSGAVELVSGGTVSGTNIQGGGTVLVRLGGHTSGDVLVGSGTTFVASETVSAGGVAVATVLSNTGLLTVSSGGLAVGAIVNNNPLGSGGGVVVLSGGTASGVTLSSGGVETLSGGTAVGTLVKNGAVVSVVGGVDNGAVISNGGTVRLTGGTDSGVTVLNGGQEIVSSGGAASGTILSSGGQMTLSSGGTANAAQVKNGGVLSVVGGIDTGATISTGGLVVVSGGTDIAVTVLSGGVELVLAGGSTSASILSTGGSETVSSGGVTVGTTILSGGRESVLSGGTASGTVVSSGGLEVISAGGLAQGTVLSAGGQEIISSGGQVTGTVVGSGGSELVSSGGAANGATILSGGTQTVLKGGTISGTTVSSGGQELVSSGGILRGAVVRAGGQEIVSNGGMASGTTIGGSETVFAGGSASGATVLSGGTQTVMKGGTVNGTMVSSGGTEVVSGTAANIVVSDGGSAVVSSGGQANATVIDSGGYELVMSGGVVSGATISGGTLEIASGGGVASSTITFAGGGMLVLDDTKFRGKIAGFAEPDTIDLTTVSFASATLGYTGNTLSGTLTVTDGTHTAKIAMLGQYAAGNFILSDDGNGGTLVGDPPLDSSGHFAPPH